jgi:class 3 adenylate cyclase
MRILVFIVLFFLHATATLAAAFEPIVITQGTHELHISNFHSLDNRDTRFDAETILSGQHDELFTSHDRYAKMLGIPSNPMRGDYWVRIELDNQTGQDLTLLSDYGMTPSVSRVFVQDAKTREIRHTIVPGEKLRRSTQGFPIPTGAFRVYLEILPDEFSMPVVNLSIKSPQGLLHDSPERHVLTMSYGICLALIAYNFVLALTLRHRAHVIYIFYNITLLLYYEGRYQVLAEQFGFPEIPRAALISINCSSSFLFLTFLYHMLDVRKHLPAWKWPLRIVFALWPLIIVFSFINLTWAQMALINMLIFATPLTMGLGIHSALKKVPGARILLVAAVIPSLGTMIHFMHQFFAQWLPHTFINCAQMLALDIEMILMSMTIGFKINREQERLRSKIDHAYTELKTIVYPHQVQQIWDGMPLDQTMPVGQKKAFIIVFDVVASSKMQIADPRAFLSAIFHDCSNLMMENYQTDPLVANGYRVKEMGDGFLCSVGFPFGCPGSNPADHSVMMAHKFLDIFKKHVERVGAPGSIHCAIGIAYGVVEAFYPESGAQVYDLFGRGIILAHRYESMRDILFRWLKRRDDIIILHQPVFDQLSDAYRDEFVEVDLTASDFKVRDDEDATRLYYQLASGRAQRHLLRGA